MTEKPAGRNRLKNDLNSLIVAIASTADWVRDGRKFDAIGGIPVDGELFTEHHDDLLAAGEYITNQLTKLIGFAETLERADEIRQLVQVAVGAGYLLAHKDADAANGRVGARGNESRSKAARGKRQDIRRMLDAGMTTAEIKAATGASASTISRARNSND